MKYRKKPVVIEAIKIPLLNESSEELCNWAENEGFENYTSERDGTIAIETLEGIMIGSPGDYIIKGVKGEFYPCKPDIFEMTYEVAE